MSFTLSGDREDIVASLATAQRAAATGGSNMTLMMLHLVKTKDDEQYVEASDQRASVRTHLWGSFLEPEVDAVVHPRVVVALNALPKGEVELVNEDGSNMVRVSGKGKAVYEVPCYDNAYPDVFPGVDAVKWDEVTAVDAKDALAAMSRGSRYVAKKETTPTITGVNLRVVDGELAVDATDSQRCYQERVALPGAGFPFGEQEVILPVRMVQELTRLFPSGEVKLTADDHRFFATDVNGTTTFMSTRIGGKYPDMDRIANDDDYKAGFEAPRKELLDALSRLGSLVGDKPVKLEVSDSELVLSARSDQGSAQEFVPLKAPGDAVVIGFNVEHLTSGLQAFEGDDVKVRYMTPQRPAVVTSSDKGKRFVVIPVRV